MHIFKKKGVFVPFYIVLLLTLSLLSFYIILTKNINKVSIHLTQNIGAGMKYFSTNTLVQNRGINILHTVQLVKSTSERRQVDEYGVCYKKKRKHLMKKITYVNATQEVSSHIVNKCTYRTKTVCKNTLVGRVVVDTSEIGLDALRNVTNLSYVKRGGWWLPDACSIERSVAIIIPFRDRDEHLALFLRHMHPILHRQNLHYRIFVIDQVDQYMFNRGKLMNVGFAEALKFFSYRCFIFHDVDLLLENDYNHYGCLSSPQHLSVAIDKFNYKILYEELFGGIEMFSREHFQLVNGFSNSFWGWGAEDDNLYRRLAWKNLSLWRSSVWEGRYKMIKHQDMEQSADMSRFDIRKESYKHYATDGLVNLQYDIKDIIERPFYTHIRVDLRKDKDKIFGVKPFPFNRKDFNL